MDEKKMDTPEAGVPEERGRAYARTRACVYVYR